jgi:hypothetical protein
MALHPNCSPPALILANLQNVASTRCSTCFNQAVNSTGTAISQSMHDDPQSPVRRWISGAICWLRPTRCNVTLETQHEIMMCRSTRHVAVSAAVIAASSGLAAVKMAVMTPGGMSARPARDRRAGCMIQLDAETAVIGTCNCCQVGVLVAPM